MSSSVFKPTPTKVYVPKNPIKNYSSICRLCGSLTDPSHSKNLFKELNILLLNMAEEIYGGNLVKLNKTLTLMDPSLNHMLCSEPRDQPQPGSFSPSRRERKRALVRG
jgi:hypothetical protein